MYKFRVLFCIFSLLLTTVLSATDIVFFDFETGGDANGPFASDSSAIGSVTGVIGVSALVVDDDWEINETIETGVIFTNDFTGATDEFFFGVLEPNSGNATLPGDMDADGDDDGSLSFTVTLDAGYVLKDFELSFWQHLDPGHTTPAWRMEYVYMGVTNQMGPDVNGSSSAVLVSSGLTPAVIDGLRDPEVTFRIIGLFSSYADGVPHNLSIDDVKLTGTLKQPIATGEWINEAQYFESWNTAGPDGWLITGGPPPPLLSEATTLPAPSPTWALMFLPLNLTAELRSPLLTNGLGTISFEYLNRQTAPNILSIETSTNGTTWTVIDKLTNANDSAWQTYTR